jgi:two-component system, cell cycle response regulator DivK
MDSKKILVVEDNSDYRELIRMFLQRSGYEIVEATTGFEGVDQAHSCRPDLILMDLGLPMMTGDEAIAQLKADPTTRDIPVLVITAFNKGILVERAVAAGAAEILHKPIDFKSLHSVMQQYLPLNEDQSNGVPHETRELHNAA